MILRGRVRASHSAERVGGEQVARVERSETRGSLSIVIVPGFRFASSRLRPSSACAAPHRSPPSPRGEGCDLCRAANLTTVIPENMRPRRCDEVRR